MKNCKLLGISALALVLASCGQNHVHQFDTKWHNDSDFHWHECSCGEKGDKAGHNFDAGHVIKEKSCTEDGLIAYTCTTCGYIFEDVVPAGHTYATELSYDATGHWYAATCEHSDLKKGYEPHEMVDDTETMFSHCKKCSYKVDLVTSLDTPTNMKFENNALSFDPVQYASNYLLTVSKGGEIVHTELLAQTSWNVIDGLFGEITLSITAKRNALVSEPAILNAEVQFKDNDQLFEAEDCVLNLSNYSYDEGASGGAYALGFDDCGQGIYMHYYAFVAGSRKMTVTYSTGLANSFMNLYVNGTNQVKVTFEKETGWFGDSGVTENVEVDITLAKGWNDLYLIKDGTNVDDPQYGGYVQLDKVVIEGTHELYSTSLFTDFGNYSLRLETECSHWHWTNPNQRPSRWGENFSNYYGLGEMNANGDGFRFDVYVEKSGTYLFQLAYGYNAGQNYSCYYAVNDGITTSQLLTAPVTGWDGVALDYGFEIELIGGEMNSIEILRGSDWFTPDYAILTFLN